MKPSAAPCDPAILAALRSRAAGRTALNFADFMEVVLYEPGIGYYRKSGPRVGRGAGTDFFTSTDSPLFGRLIVAACGDLLGNAPLSQYDFIEMGSEPGAGILSGIKHPFRSHRQVRIGESLKLGGQSIVFSNELFDAQPFRRFRYAAGAWRELGVSLEGDTLSETEISGAVIPQLPSPSTEGYVVDAPVASADLAAAIAGQPWEGLFLAFDYGKSWEEIAHATPQGTARSYRHHVQSNDLLAHAGDQDLTCHVCWDWLSDALARKGFTDPRVESQEAFFAHHCSPLLEGLSRDDAGRLSRDKLSILQLLHPVHMGQRFQAIWAVRGSPSVPGP
jgi:SAM-dependent MidA family methyltransferase